MSTTKYLMYSFKGGSGRTVTLANSAFVLAREMGRRVLVIDLDIESAGSSVLFGIDEAVRKGECWTVQDVLRGSFAPNPAKESRSTREKAQPPRETIVINTEHFESKLWPRLSRGVWPDPEDSSTRRGSLRVLPARIVLNSFEEPKYGSTAVLRTFEHLLEKIDDLAQPPEIVLFDSASGQQATAQMGLAYCDVLVVFVRWTRQFIVGTLQFLEEYICTERFCPRIKRVLIVPTAVPRTPPEGRIATQLAERRARLDDTLFRINQAAGRNFGKSAGWMQLCDPIFECQALKWDDRVLIMDASDATDVADGSVALEDYRRLCRTLLESAERLKKGPGRA